VYLLGIVSLYFSRHFVIVFSSHQLAQLLNVFFCFLLLLLQFRYFTGDVNLSLWELV
jgi:hypothetical protein